MLVVNEKTGFKATSNRVVIFRDGQPFYAKTRQGYDLVFNLPAGVYKVEEGTLKKMKEPVYYKKAKLPLPNKRSNFPGRIEISFIDNPNKCSVDLSSSKITRVFFDHSFKDCPWFVLIWIIGHEMAHFLYRGQGQLSERNCDNYSANMMLDLGYNPSQIDAAIDLAISNGFHARKRKKTVYENLIKNYK